MTQKQTFQPNDAILITIAGDVRDEEVIARKFSIEGWDDVFGVHASIGEDKNFLLWTATHADTGFAIARGNDIEGVIAMARAVWLSKPREEVEAAIASAHTRRKLMRIADIANS